MASSTSKAKNYKFKELKTYTSNDWLLDKKKYRNVFTDDDLDYIRAEI